MNVKFISIWGWTNSTPMDTPEEAIAAVPANKSFEVSMYPAGVKIGTEYGVPTLPAIRGFLLRGVKGE